MSNSAYLCGLRSDDLYPSSTDPAYDARLQTLAMDAGAIPLLWLAAFREADLKTQAIQDDEGKEVTVTAPICRMERALSNLQAAQEPLQRAFPEQANLKGYFSYLRETLESCELPWLTMEISEIEFMADPKAFQETLRSCLRGFEEEPPPLGHRQKQGFWGKLPGAGSTAPRSWRSCLLELTVLKAESAFPVASMFIDKKKFSEDEGWNHCRLLGDALFRPVSWMPSEG